MSVEPAIIEALARSGAEPPKPTRDPELRRRLALEYGRSVHDHVALRGPELATRDHTVPVPGHPDVRVRLYYPPGTGPDADAAARPPVCLAFYGGAFRLHGLEHPGFSEVWRLRAQRAGIAVAGVDYALAPEHRFPTPVEQGHAALEWLVREGERLGVDPARMAIGGCSAGGNIAAAVALANRDRANRPLALQLLEAPILDLTGRSVDWSALSRWHPLAAPVLRRHVRDVTRDYLPSRAAARESYASPLLAPDLAGLPPAHICTAEHDPLRGDGERYAAALAAAGVPVAASRLIGQDHQSPIFEKVSMTARAAQAGIAAALASLHAGDRHDCR